MWLTEAGRLLTLKTDKNPSSFEQVKVKPEARVIEGRSKEENDPKKIAFNKVLRVLYIEI